MTRKPKDGRSEGSSSRALMRRIESSDERDELLTTLAPVRSARAGRMRLWRAVGLHRKAKASLTPPTGAVSGAEAHRTGGMRRRRATRSNMCEAGEQDERNQQEAGEQKGGAEDTCDCDIQSHSIPWSRAGVQEKYSHDESKAGWEKGVESLCQSGKVQGDGQHCMTGGGSQSVWKHGVREKGALGEKEVERQLHVPCGEPQFEGPFWLKWPKASIATAWWVRCTLAVSFFRISGKTLSNAAPIMEHRSGTRRLVATHPRSTSTISKVADERSAEVQREGSGNSSSKFSSLSASPWSSALSTTTFQCEGRVTKLEAAMAAVGESDPTFAGLQDALKKANTAQAKLQSEEQGLADAEARLASLLLEGSNGIAASPPTVLVDFAQELAELRACVQQLQRENTDLRSQLQFEGQSCEERERKHPRNLSSSTLDLALLLRNHGRAEVCTGQSAPLFQRLSESSVRMETLIDNAEASVRSNPFNPLSS